jgi:membrane associated rhomboid family serine protease
VSELFLPEMLLLFAGALVALQMVALVIRRSTVDDAPYLALLVGDLAVLAWVHATRRYDSRLSFVAEAVAVALTIGPRLLDGIERRALGRDDLGRAARVAAVRELVSPGRTAARRRRQLTDLAEARAGGSARVVRRLQSEIDGAEDAAQAAGLREELATMLILDQRYREATEFVERTFSADGLARRPAFAAHLVRAYGELGQLGQAAAVLVRLEETVGGDASAALLLLQARLTFLAYLGCVQPLESLLAGPTGALVSTRGRALLLGVAHARAGDSARQPPEALALAEATAARVARSVRVRRRRRAPVTLGLIAANLVIFLVAGSTGIGDEAGLIRAGALFRPALVAGEWWRAVSAMFLHAGLVHLAINMYGLYLLGRFSEEVLGGSRYFVVYLAGGLAGAAASTGMSSGALSVGASGAIMGLLGALIVLLVLRRGTWPESWRRLLLWNLVFLGALQIYIGFQLPMIDNAAHVGGMLGGAAAALLVAPGLLLGSGRAARAIVGVLVASLLAALAVSALAVARTPLEATLARLPTREVEAGGCRLSVLSYWEVDGERGRLEDPYLGVRLTVERLGGEAHVESPQAHDPRYRALIERIARSAAPRLP